jgi:hypothetical protein
MKSIQAHNRISTSLAGNVRSRVLPSCALNGEVFSFTLTTRTMFMVCSARGRT